MKYCSPATHYLFISFFLQLLVGLCALKDDLWESPGRFIWFRRVVAELFFVYSQARRGCLRVQRVGAPDSAAHAHIDPTLAEPISLVPQLFVSVSSLRWNDLTSGGNPFLAKEGDRFVGIEFFPFGGSVTRELPRKLEAIEIPTRSWDCERGAGKTLCVEMD